MDLFLDVIVQASAGSLLIKLLLNALALFAAAHLIKGVEIKDFTRAVIIAVILALLNTTMGSILKFFAYPFNFITFGLINLLIDAIVIMVADYFVKGFQVKGFWLALLLALVLTVFNSILYQVFL